jgi:hypothetical protein
VTERAAAAVDLLRVDLEEPHAAGARAVVADVNDEKGKALADELGIRYVHTDAGSEDDVTARVHGGPALAPVRVSVDVHGGRPPADGC